jgi:hypothetical protein
MFAAEVVGDVRLRELETNARICERERERERGVSSKERERRGRVKRRGIPCQ